MIEISPKKQTISVGVVIELSSDAATHLSYALSGYQKFTRRDQWPWLDTFVEKLNEARGSGCIMGGRIQDIPE